MMYEIQFKQGRYDDNITSMLITEEQNVAIKELQQKGSVGTWLGKQYISFSSINRIITSNYNLPKQINHKLQLNEGKSEDVGDERTRIRKRLKEMRENMMAKGLI